MISFIKSSALSGNTTVSGFKLDDQFIGIEPSPNYLDLIYQDFTNAGKLIFSNDWKGDFDLELITLVAGNNTGAKLQSVEVSQGSFSLWYSQFGRPTPPYRFQTGLLIPSGSKLIISMTSPVQYLRLIAKPVIPVNIGLLSAT